MNPAIERIKVVLPTPFGPVMSKLSPFFKEKFKSLISSRLPRLRLISSIFSAISVLFSEKFDFWYLKQLKNIFNAPLEFFL